MRYTSRTPDYDLTDDLMASVGAVLKEREAAGIVGFTSVDLLKGWLSEAGEDFEDRQLDLALGHLKQIGRLQRPRVEYWHGEGERPWWWVDAVPYTGE